MTIDQNGVQIDDFQTIFSNLETGLKNIYGSDIDLSQNTPDGQQIGIYTNVIYDLQSLILKIYNSFDPDFAVGHELDKILKLIASSRIPATKSTVDITITANKNVTLPVGYTVKDDNGNEWVATASPALIVGANIVSFESVKWGAITAQAGSITTPVTILTEIDTVNNPASAVVGRNEESDIELRRRRNNLLSINSKSLVSSLYAKLLAISAVVDVVVYENNADVVDAKGVPPHSLWIIVEGGDVAQIGDTIAIDKNIGCGLKGTISHTYVENFIRGDGTTRTHTHQVFFDRPVITNIFIRFNVKKKNITDVIDMALIKNKLMALIYNIGSSITVTELYGTIYTAGSNFTASTLELSKDNVTWVQDALLANYDERLVITYSNILITEIV